MEKNKAEKVMGCQGQKSGGMRRIFNRVVREGLTQKVVFEQDLVEVEIEPRKHPGEEYSKCKEQI